MFSYMRTALQTGPQ